uniref:Uncharacterized protein n=1 Tax=Brassica oleracea var. oleracea TaxID=109376 RepID=A0A0D3BKN8_BRAOL
MPMPMSERRRVLPSSNKSDPFHIIHKIPFGDCPYVRAKHAQRREEELENMREGSAWVSFGSEDRPGRTRPYMAVQAVQSGRTVVDLNSTKCNL